VSQFAALCREPLRPLKTSNAKLESVAPRFDKGIASQHGKRVLKAAPESSSTQTAPSAPPSVSPLFCTTHWSVVLAAGQAHTPHAAEALESLCRAYWRPVFSFVRRHGHDVETALDLTQEFFARLLEGNWLQPADPNRGRFRSFLLRCLSRFLVDEWRRATAQKRGGRMTFFSIDEAREQEDAGLEPVESFTPEQAYDRNWAESVVARANTRLRRGYEAEGLAERFHVLKAYLASDQEPLSYAAAAEQLGLTLPAVKSAIHKLRQRYGEAVRAEIAETVSRPEEIQTELNHLLDALGG